MMKNKRKVWQYFSKWRKEWVDFNNQPPGEGEIELMTKRSKYKVRTIIK